MDDTKSLVRERYGSIAAGGVQGGCCGGSGCGSGDSSTKTATIGLGYDEVELSNLPEGADLGLGCGNPHAIAGLRRGETVLDLGAGGGIDVFLAAKRVGPKGRAIGVDMTPRMVSRARKAAARAGISNVEFRLGEIEALPIADESVDVVISNCVVNLSPDKTTVFQEAHRVLKPGGRLAISDMVATSPLDETVRLDPDAYTGCVGGAATFEEIERMLVEAGFEDVRVRPQSESSAATSQVVSATVEARRRERS